VGQLYNSPRDSASNVPAIDPIDTVLTTQGYLSNGNSHPVSIMTGLDDDKVTVYMNRHMPEINGNSGNDTVLLRFFI